MYHTLPKGDTNSSTCAERTYTIFPVSPHSSPHNASLCVPQCVATMHSRHAAVPTTNVEGKQASKQVYVSADRSDNFPSPAGAAAATGRSMLRHSGTHKSAVQCAAKTKQGAPVPLIGCRAMHTHADTAILHIQLHTCLAASPA